MHSDRRLAQLTERERDVLALLAAGRSDLGISEALVVTRKTVEFHTRNIFKKLDLPTDPTANRRVLAALAFRRAAPDASTGGESAHLMRWAALLLLAAVLAVATPSGSSADGSRPMPTILCPPAC